MTFSEVLNLFIEEIGCTSKELAKESNISEALISRYRNMDKIPKYKSDKYNNLIDGLIKLSKKYNINDLDDKKINSEFDKIFSKDNIDFDIFRENLNFIISELKINVSDLSKSIGFDSSYVSKIRNNIRKPQNTSDFASSISRYIVNNYDNNNISSVTGISIVNSDNLYKWMTNNTKNEEVPINSFLTKLDDFDLNEYIKSIKFDKLKVPTMPISIPKQKIYYGLKGYKDSQIDTLKQIILSKSKDDVFFYSNMSMTEANKDLDFKKKFMVGLAFMLKKGLHLNMIHDLDRPFNELLLGLEGWIPLYMTGQISPYYFKDNSNKLFCNTLCVSEAAALSGSYVSNNINTSRFYLTNKQEELKYYNESRNLLLKKANSLMDIYNQSRKNEFKKYLDSNIDENRRNILTNLPIYTISDELLDKILDNNKIEKKDRNILIKYVNAEKERVSKILKNNKIVDEITILTKEEFEINKCYLSLSKIFYDNKIIYTYEDYINHINLIKEFKKKNKNYDFKINNTNIFKNINIHIIDNKQAVISKENTPSIHFVIHHPKLINAISNFESQM